MKQSVHRSGGALAAFTLRVVLEGENESASAKKTKTALKTNDLLMVDSFRFECREGLLARMQILRSEDLQGQAK